MMLLRNWAVVLAGVPLISAAAGPVSVGAFSKSDITGWERRAFQGHTEYSLAEEDGRTVLAAQSRAAASGFFRKIDVDLTATPVLNWSWKIDNILTDVDERQKSGDDYPARIYVVFTSGATFWKARALNYVWSSTQAAGAEWPNAYAPNSYMIAVEGGAEQVGRWREYKRDVRADFKKYFGEDVTHAEAIAVVTETDDSRQNAVAWYSDIFFTAE